MEPSITQQDGNITYDLFENVTEVINSTEQLRGEPQDPLQRYRD